MSSAARRTTLGWALVAVLALVLGGLALSLAHRGVNRARANARKDVPSSHEGLPIPSGASLGVGEQFSADAAGGPDLWSFARVKAGLRVQRWAVTSSAVSPQAASLCTSPPAGFLNAAVASWPGAPRRALVLAAERGDSIVVQVRRAVPPCVMLVRARTPALPLVAGDTRSVFVGSDRRGYAELIVVDRPATAAGKMRIRVLRGETRFRSVTRYTQLKGANSWPVPKWDLTVGSVDSTSGDLLFISRTQPTRSGKIEVHALLSSKDYNGYGTQKALSSPEGAGVDWSYALAHGANGAPILYGIDSATRQLMRFPL